MSPTGYTPSHAVVITTALGCVVAMLSSLHKDHRVTARLKAWPLKIITKVEAVTEESIDAMC